MFTSPALISELVIFCFAGFLACVAYSDYSTYKIPNRFILSILALYPAHVAVSYPNVDWVGGLLTGGVLLGICFLLYAKRWTGAGDAKLVAAVGVWAGPDLVVPFILVTTAAGGAISVLVMIRRYFGTLAAEDGSLLARVLPTLSIHIPYGIAISAGGFFVASRLIGH